MTEAMNKEQLLELTKALLMNHYVVYRDWWYEREHFEIGGDHEALAELAWGEESGTMIVYKRAGDYIDPDYERVDPSLEKFLGSITIDCSDCSPSEEREADVTFWFRDEYQHLEAELMKESDVESI